MDTDQVQFTQEKMPMGGSHCQDKTLKALDQRHDQWPYNQENVSVHTQHNLVVSQQYQSTWMRTLTDNKTGHKPIPKELELWKEKNQIFFSKYLSPRPSHKKKSFQKSKSHSMRCNILSLSVPRRMYSCCIILALSVLRPIYSYQKLRSNETKQNNNSWYK